MLLAIDVLENLLAGEALVGNDVAGGNLQHCADGRLIFDGAQGLNEGFLLQGTRGLDGLGDEHNVGVAQGCEVGGRFMACLLYTSRCV